MLRKPSLYLSIIDKKYNNFRELNTKINFIFSIKYYILIFFFQVKLNILAFYLKTMSILIIVDILIIIALLFPLVLSMYISKKSRDLDKRIDRIFNI